MRYVIIGGGVAGVACYEELSRVCKEGDSVTLLSATDTVKCVTKIEGSGRILEELEVAERPLSSLDAPSYSDSSVSLRVVQCAVSRVDTEARVVHLAQGDEVPYDRLCLCTGAVPRVPPRIQHDHPLMLCVRDSGSIHALRATLGLSRRVVVVGNGGIALGLLSEAPSLPSTCELHWVVREDYLGGTFLAATASDFLLGWAAEHRKAGGGAAGAPPSITVASGGEAVGEGAATSTTTAQDLDYGVSASMFSHRISVEDRIGGGGSGSCGGGGGGGGEEEVGTTSAPPPLLSSPLPQRQSTKGRLQRKQQALLSQAHLVSHEGGGVSGEGVASKPPPPPPPSAGGSGLSAFSSGAPPIPTAFHPPPQTNVRFGASLGPNWAQSLALSRGEGNASGGASFTVTRRAEVSAIRGVPGTPGAVGEFISGEWVDLTTTPESSSLPSSLPLPQPPPSPPHNVPCGAEGGGGGGAAAAGDVALPLLSHAPLPWPLHLLLSNGEVIGCDAVVWAIGVTPSIPPLTPSPAFLHHSDGGLIVNPHMQISGGGGRVYAAGDCASVLWPRAPISTATTSSSSTAAGVSALPLPHPPLPLWFQMRTWGQALTTGAYAARCMAGVTKESLEDGDGGVAFQAFSHTTRVLGLKTVLLGAFNGQGLGEAWERVVRGGRVKGGEGGGGSSLGGEKGAGASVGSPWGKVHLLLRVTPGVEFVQVVVVGGRVVGALLMGETDLEETMENLILNGTNVRVKRGGGGRCKGGREEEGEEEEEEETLLDLLNPDLELEDYFD